jgi:hypothetical protein
VSWLCLYLVRSLATDNGEHRTVRDFGIGISLICGPLAGVGVAGHFEEPLIAGLLLLAALRAKEGQDTSAALWLAMASGFKLWGLLGVPILLLGATRPALLRRLAIFGVACAALYLPFFLFGTVRTFDFSWPVWPSATVGFFLTGRPFSWQLRMLQGALVCVGGAGLALRKSVPAWALPTAVIAIRLLFDPEQVPYYWVALVVCLVVGAWAGVQQRWTLTWTLTTAGALLALVMPYLAGDRVDRALHTVGLAVVLAALFLPLRRIKRPAPVPRP